MSTVKNLKLTPVPAGAKDPGYKSYEGNGTPEGDVVLSVVTNYPSQTHYTDHNNGSIWIVNAENVWEEQ